MKQIVGDDVLARYADLSAYVFGIFINTAIHRNLGGTAEYTLPVGKCIIMYDMIPSLFLQGRIFLFN